MKIALTGSTGLLGSAIAELAQLSAITVTPLDHTFLRTTSVGELADKLSGNDVVIHAAANTNVEACEIYPDDCYRDNWLLTEKVAVAAKRTHTRMATISSTGVYGDYLDTAYAEYDAVHPTTHHHKSKVLAEQSTLRMSADNLVIRTGWLFGGARANPKNFVARRIEEALVALQAGRSMSSNAEQFGVPCYVGDVAARLMGLIRSDLSGVFNCVNSGYATRFDYVAAIVSAANLDIALYPSDAASFSRKAQVSNNEMARNWRMESSGFPTMKDWKASLIEYVNKLNGLT